MNIEKKRGKVVKRMLQSDKVRRQLLITGADARGIAEVDNEEEEKNWYLNKMLLSYCGNNGKHIKNMKKPQDVNCCFCSMNVDNLITLTKTSLQQLPCYSKKSCSCNNCEEPHTQTNQQHVTKGQHFHNNNNNHHHHHHKKSAEKKKEEKMPILLSQCQQPSTECVNGDSSAHFSKKSSLSFRSASCTTSDFRAVEEELRELLSGYHKIVDNACENNNNDNDNDDDDDTRRLEKSLKTSTAATSTLSATTKLSEKSRRCQLDDPLPADSRGSNCVNGGSTEVAHNRHLIQSVVSLPVSSVIDDYSTDANTPVPCLETGRCESFVKDGVEDCSQTNDDLFADALTEDQLNRSFEMQWQQKQLAQKVCRNICSGGVPSLQAVQNNSNATLLWDSFSKIEDETCCTAIKQDSASSVLLPSVGRNMRYPPDGNSQDRALTYNMSYDSRVYTPHRYQETTSSTGKPLSGDLTGGKELTEIAAAAEVLRGGAPAPRFLKCDAHNKEGAHGDVGPSEQQAVCDEGVVVGPPYSKTQRRRKSSSSRWEVVGSTIPEIATSARQTENPSMRSGVPGGWRTHSRPRDAGLWRRTRRIVGAIGRKDIGEISGGNNTCYCGAEKDNGPLRSQMMRSFAAGCGVAANNADVHKGNGRRHTNQPRHCSTGNGKTDQRCVLNAASRFHAMVERRVAAFETKDAHDTAQLPAFADSLVGAAISNLYPVVKKRQAQLKVFLDAEAAAAAAVDASLTRTVFR